MRKIFTLFIFLLCLQNSKAQYVTIPDANFVAWLQANVPSAMSGNQMDTTNVFIISRAYINIPSLNIADITGIQYFDSLSTLNIENNLLTSIPHLSDMLQAFGCSYNQLTSLTNIPNSLTSFDCSYNQLTSLPSTSSNFSGTFDCHHNLLTSLPSMPNVDILNCNNNQLTSLPTLSGSLLILNCDSNQLTTLPVLPNSMYTLICSNNLLTNLPLLPDFPIIEVRCNNNQLITLSNNLSNVSYLDCSNNLLTSLPDSAGYISYLDCSNNNISCFPLFHNDGLDISNNPFNCLPNYISAMDATTLSYPLCAQGNSNGCPNGIENGASEQFESKSYLLYPNPSNGTFTIELNNKQKQSIQVFDITGNIVLSQNIENGKSTIDANHFAAGIYNVSIKGKDSITNKKLVIVK